jgi:phosphoribosylanthranilate isomerase
VEQCKELNEAGVRIIKVFSVGPEFDFESTKPYHSTAKFFLFDTAGEGYGGTGKTFDWRLLRKYDQEIPFFLSGGLNPQNVSSLEELKGMNLHALDLNSGVESEPGVKEVNQIEEVLAKVTVIN